MEEVNKSNMLLVGVYEPPANFLYQESDLIDFISGMSEDFVDCHPAVLYGGDVNYLDLELLSTMSGLTALVDFPTRGDACLDNCVTNTPQLFSNPTP